MTDAVDVGVDHQRINESKNEHHPERRPRVKEEHAEEIGEMKQTGHCGNRVPSRVCEKLGVGRRSVYANGVGCSHGKKGGFKSIILLAEIWPLGK